MVLTASLCDAPHLNQFELGKYRECICRRVAPDYAADLSIPILEHGRNTPRQCAVYICRPNYYGLDEF